MDITIDGFHSWMWKVVNLKIVTMQILIYALRYIYEGTGVVAPFSLLWLPLGDLQCICSLLHLSSGELP